MVRFSFRGPAVWRAVATALVGIFLAGVIVAPTPALAADAANATVWGRVITQDNAPVEAATVTVWAPGNVSAGVAVTDAGGRYRISGLVSGDYLIHYEAPEGTQLVPVWYPNRTSFETDTAMYLAESAGKRMDVYLAPGGALSGVVRTAAGPSKNTVVTAHLNGRVSETRTDSSGRYLLDNLDVGDYALSFTPRASEPYLGEWWHNKPDRDSATLVSVVAGTTRKGVDAVLALGGSIAGTVTGVNSHGDGIKGVEVTVRQLSGEVMGTAKTNSAGRYVVTGLPENSEYYVHFGTAGVPAYASQWLSNSPTRDGAPFVRVKASSAVKGKNIILPLAATIAGRVTGSESPTVGLGSVVITAFDQSGFAVSTAKTGTNGKYVLRGIPAGRFTIGYHHPAKASKYLDEYWKNTSTLDDANYFAVAARATVTHRDAVLTVGSIVSGVVTVDDESHEPDPFTMVFLFDDRRRFPAVAWTNYRGKYKFPAITAGTYRLQFQGSGDEWWNDAASFETSTPLVLSGQDVTADAALTYKPKQLPTPPVPVISGGARVGDVVEVDAGVWSPAPVELSYQWNSNGSPIPGEIDRSWIVGPHYAGTRLSVTVTGGKSGYRFHDVMSEPTATVRPGSLPAMVPRIEGTPTVGRSLMLRSDEWGPAGVEFLPRWKRDGKNIAGAIHTSYKLVSADAGHRVSVTVTGRLNGDRYPEATSAEVRIGKALTRTSTPTISGKAKIGAKLTSKPGSWTPARVSMRYQWRRNGVDIANATRSRYVVSSADKHKSITVVVTGSRTGYTSVSKSSSAKRVR